MRRGAARWRARRGRGRDPQSDAADPRPRGFEGARARRARKTRAADPRTRVVLRGGLGGRRGDRQHQHPAGDDAGDAPRVARPRNRAAAGVRRRQSLSVSRAGSASNACSRRSSRAMRACRRSARLPFSRRPRAMRSCAISTGDIRAFHFQGTRDTPRLLTSRRSMRWGPARCTGAVFRRCAATTSSKTSCRATRAASRC